MTTLDIQLKKIQMLNEGELYDKITDFLSKKLSLSKISELSKKSNDLDRTLLKHAKNLGVDVESIKQYAKSLINKKDKNEKDIAKNLSIITKKSAIFVAKKYGTTNKQDVLKAISIFVVMLFASIFLSMLLIPFAVIGGATVAIGIKILLYVFLLPYVEEYAKQVGILSNVPYLYVSFFAIFEFLQYVTILPYHLVGNIFLRLPALIMHFTTTFIQKKTIESGETEGKDLRAKALLIGLAIHAIYNSFGLYFEENIVAIAKEL